ncbi:MAG: hypothetical protein F4246_09475 [Rhodothermaceae bacterium]|nr:hypothetical protein [Rhodothermaceae bacterium]MYD57232.1 hypothetical protein [Rhodothermaceae bacterium]MYJ54998.1 hypothetical protein [Rhodothermaceae bacterium]
MSLRFSNDGPEFPGDLVDSLLKGEVVFLCGSGISRPQLPDFKGLVERTYKELSMDMSKSEEIAFKAERYEEVLGSLRQRLADPEKVTRPVSDLLAVPTSACLDHHCTILRLARDLDNRIIVVTTNFDTLLERAAVTLNDKDCLKKISSAGQALPAPGSSDFTGIVHIHGRLADPELDLEQSPLVLTSTDFGEAYMRSGWASRFFFDLVRCRDILLVGYSANDVPVRYLLNVLEADRTRFSDLRQVYAFAEYKDDKDKQEAVAFWQILAVKALPYCKMNENTGEEDHATLWRDLRELVYVVEYQQEAFRSRVITILKQDVSESCPQSRNEIVWLLKKPRNLWSVALDAIMDPKWFDFFRQDGAWHEAEIARFVSVWVGRDLQNTDRFDCALRWQRQVGQPFTEHMAAILSRANNLDQDWKKVWRLFCLAVPAQRNDTAFSRVQMPLNNEIVLDCDLRLAVAQLAPKLELGRSPRARELANRGHPLASILNARIDVSDYKEAEELANSLCKMSDHTQRILELATWELRSILELEKELGLIHDEHDYNDWAVPSVESHLQNESHGGKVFLVQLLSKCLTKAHTLDPEGTKCIVECWKHFPGRIGLRLYLHAMRNPALFSADDAISILLSVSEQDFWRLRRESALLIRDRAGNAAPELVREFELLIRDSSRSYYGRYTLQPNESDWREHARDNAVWLLLRILEDADALSPIGANELESIIERRSHLDRAIEDRDFFGTYISQARLIVGDPTPIVQAQEEDRLQVARKQIASRDLEEREGWATYCRSDPVGALDTLLQRAFDLADSELWNTLLYVLASSDSSSTQQCENLSARALGHLFKAKTKDLHSVLPALCTLVRQTWESNSSTLDGWVVRLWESLEQHPEQETDHQDDLYKQATQSPAGQLTEVLLLKIEALFKEGRIPTTQQFQLLIRITEYPGTVGLVGRAVLVRNIAFLIHCGLSVVVENLKPVLHAENEEGKKLRIIILQYHPTSALATTHIKDALLKGLLEWGWDHDRARRKVASWVVLPALANIEQDADTTVQWGITAADATGVLKRSSPALLVGALEVLNDVLSYRSKCERDNPEAAWSSTVVPFFEKIWPNEGKFWSTRHTSNLLKLAVGAGNKFPQACRFLEPYIVPRSSSFSGLHVIAESDMPEMFPSETLGLLWDVYGRSSTSDFYFLPDLIDRLVMANPNLETDRRLQALKQQAVIP